MKLGFGLYRHMLTPEYLTFARQAGAEYVVVHLVDYFGSTDDTSEPGANQPVGTSSGWGPAGDPEEVWRLEDILSIKERIGEAGLRWYAIENIDPAHWHDVLLDGPHRERQIAQVQDLVRRIGEADIPVLGYNFSLAGIAGRTQGSFARGGATSVGMTGEIDETPIPNGMVWNMVYDDDTTGHMATVTPKELWGRLQRFLDEVLPVAEEAGVSLAAHPDDPPLPTLRGQPRLLHRKKDLKRLLDLNPSPANKLQFCVGTVAEMSDGNVYDVLRRCCERDGIAYLHCRNVTGRAPDYRETFIDNGDVDFHQVMDILKDEDFRGILIPDHAPLMDCEAPWHAGMAFTMGFLSSFRKLIDT